MGNCIQMSLFMFSDPNFVAFLGSEMGFFHFLTLISLHNNILREKIRIQNEKKVRMDTISRKRGAENSRDNAYREERQEEMTRKAVKGGKGK